MDNKNLPISGYKKLFFDTGEIGFFCAYRFMQRTNLNITLPEIKLPSVEDKKETKVEDNPFSL